MKISCKLQLQQEVNQTHKYQVHLFTAAGTWMRTDGSYSALSLQHTKTAPVSLSRASIVNLHRCACQTYLYEVECHRNDRHPDDDVDCVDYQLRRIRCRRIIHSKNITVDDTSVDAECLPDVINKFLLSVTAHVPAIDENAFNDIRHSLGDVPDNFIVPELSVFNALKRLKVTKAVNDEFLSNRIVKEFADVLAAPVCSLINSSIRQGVVPSQWKTARITPIPKVHPPVSVETDLRPISITSSIAKVAETFICQFFNEHFNSLIDENQYGCILTGQQRMH
jgi:hypothetical protein